MQKDNGLEDLEGESEAVAKATGSKPNVLRLVRSRQCHILILARFLTDPVYYFILFWFPRYLEKARGFDTKMVGEYAWVPFLFKGAGRLHFRRVAFRSLHSRGLEPSQVTQALDAVWSLSPAGGHAHALRIDRNHGHSRHVHRALR